MRTEFQRCFLIGTLCATCILMPGHALAAEGKVAPPASSPAQPAAAIEVRPSIQLPETSFDFGEAMEGSEVTHEFVVKNTGSAELQIQQVRPG